MSRNLFIGDAEQVTHKVRKVLTKKNDSELKIKKIYIGGSNNTLQLCYAATVKVHIYMSNYVANVTYNVTEKDGTTWSGNTTNTGRIVTIEVSPYATIQWGCSAIASSGSYGYEVYSRPYTTTLGEQEVTVQFLAQSYLRYSVKFYDQDGVTLKYLYYRRPGTTLTAPELSAPPHYFFNRWVKISGDIQHEGRFVTPGTICTINSDSELKALYSSIKYTCIFQVYPKNYTGAGIGGTKTYHMYYYLNNEVENVHYVDSKYTDPDVLISGGRESVDFILNACKHGDVIHILAVVYDPDGEDFVYTLTKNTDVTVDEGGSYPLTVL